MISATAKANAKQQDKKELFIRNTCKTWNTA